ncbi:MAG: alpha/beta fold hydrolase [Candidatus Magasanikbacteria bacterium]|nr:alpha/beta fold hydrolase [Candidatus Magasanikbacteria bacterium]
MKDYKLIILPGWGGSHETWSEFIELSKNELETVCIDLPCFGDQPCPDEVWGVEEYAEFVKDRIREIKKKNDSKKIIVLGHSFGGQVAAYLCSKNGSICDFLVLSGPAVFRQKSSLRNYIFYAFAKFGKLFFRLPLMEKFETTIKKIFYRLIKSPDYNDAVGVKREIFKKIIRQDLSGEISKIKNPTLVIWGEKDKYVPVKYAAKLDNLLRNSELEIIKDGKHGLHIQQPEALMKFIINFVNKQ